MAGRLLERTWRFDPTLYAPAKYRRACRYEAFLPDLLSGQTFSVDASLAGILSDAERAVGRLNEGAYSALAPLARLLLRTESIASSKVEGMEMDARALARAEARLDSGGRIGQVTEEILANIDAMELAVRDAADAESFGIDHIRGIHAELMRRSPTSRNAGEIRTVQNWIGGNDYNPCGADFVPPPPDLLGPLLDDLCVAINDQTLPPILQAALVHAQFETIHPFDDGNGRTGRALIHVVLRRRGLAPTYVPPISVILASDRDRYISGLTSFREEGPDRWIEQFAVAVARSAQLATSYIAAVRELTDRWRDMLRAAGNPRSDAAAWGLIDILPAHPVITTPVAVAATGRVKSVVHQAITRLEDAGVLLPLSGNARRNRSWEAVGLLDLISDLEDGKKS